MTTTERALIAEAKRHDEAMTRPGWAYDQTSGQIIAPSGVNQFLSKTICEMYVQNHLANAAGIAWLRTNLRALLDGYSRALDEAERLRALGNAAANAVDALQGIEQRTGEELLATRTELGELKLVLEQQDRDLERMRAAQVECDRVNLDSMAEIQRLTDELRRWKSPCADIESEPRGWICPTCKDPNCGI